MYNTEKVADRGRRTFLTGVAVAGGAAAIAGGAHAAVESEDDSADSKSRMSKPHGYRTTPHIKKYYEKARF
ncbi:MAG: hypothetical protein OEU36_25810 [Gammaproteobacteria bacterium]|nr:hypothetical protein [Gammaproteobacteria bacterium]